MARVRTTIVICDVCGDKNRPTQRYYLTLPGDGRVGLDLCEEDAAPLEKFRGKKPATNTGTHRVMSMEEVEALKKQGPPAQKRRGKK